MVEPKIDIVFDMFTGDMFELLTANKDKSIDKIDFYSLKLKMGAHYWKAITIIEETGFDDMQMNERLNDELLDMANYCMFLYGKINGLV